MHSRRIAALGTALAAAMVAVGPLALTSTAGSVAAPTVTKPVPTVVGHMLRQALRFPPTTDYCRTNLGIACYSPLQYRTAYNLAPLYKLGDTGKGQTIAIVDAFGSSTIENDLQVFDAQYGIPVPPSFKIIQPAGPVTYDPTSSDQAGWAGETTLDVEYAHAIAPGANILLVETPVTETEGVQGFPEIVQAENYVIDHNLAQVISQSFGATENTFPSRQSLLDLRSAFLNAAAHHVTVLGASGDNGATSQELDGSTLYPYPVNSWPSSDPLVTSIGGTQLDLDANGHKLAPDVVWNDGYGAAGGGLSQVFNRPSFQNGVKNVVGRHRGTPDISMTAAVNGGGIVYITAPGNAPGWHIYGGTSEASPIFSGIVALTTQLARGKIGDINPALYALGRAGKYAGIVDVTSGNISFAGVIGPSATKGYDLASGWGTIDAARFVPALALASKVLH